MTLKEQLRLAETALEAAAETLSHHWFTGDGEQNHEDVIATENMVRDVLAKLRTGRPSA